MDKNEMICLLNQREDLQKFLFIRGFLITNKELQLKGFPFYNNWKEEKHGEYSYLMHSLTNYAFYENSNGRVFFIMGHAYNPFTMKICEEHILQRISEAYEEGSWLEQINELTGIFVLGTAYGTDIEFLVDASGMQSACYGLVNDTFYITSHAQLVADIEKLDMDSFVVELVQYKWYNRVMGPYLPGDLTPFTQLKRVVPNIIYQYKGDISQKRFWPLIDIEMATSKKAYTDVIKKASNILANNLELVSQKWKRPWISLTGGIDSNTTFAAANGKYDCFESFSYFSAEKEKADIEAAKLISGKFGVKHNLFNIPTHNCELPDYQLKVAIQRHNSGYIAERYENESRKRQYLERHCNCDVEVKSWTSETIRAYWYKHYNRKNMPKLSAKLFRNLYKIFIFNRKLAHKIDKIFAEYIEKFEYEKIPNNFLPADMHYNEVTWGSWGGVNISEMKYCFDITIPYNNRVFLEEMFKVPLEKRISDQHHKDIKKALNKELYDMNIRVVNMKETKFRANALNVIFTLNSWLPF